MFRRKPQVDPRRLAGPVQSDASSILVASVPLRDFRQLQPFEIKIAQHSPISSLALAKNASGVDRCDIQFGTLLRARQFLERRRSAQGTSVQIQRDAVQPDHQSARITKLRQTLPAASPRRLRGFLSCIGGEPLCHQKSDRAAEGALIRRSEFIPGHGSRCRWMHAPCQRALFDSAVNASRIRGMHVPSNGTHTATSRLSARLTVSYSLHLQHSIRLSKMDGGLLTATLLCPHIYAQRETC